MNITKQKINVGYHLAEIFMMLAPKMCRTRTVRNRIRNAAWTFLAAVLVKFCKRSGRVVDKFECPLGKHQELGLAASGASYYQKRTLR